MITKQIEVNGKKFRITLTDQVIIHVNNLKSLYAVAYEDPEGFEQVSSEISSAIREISTAVEPEATDGDLDGLIQEIIRVVDSKAAEMEQELSNHAESSRKTKRSRSKK